MRITGCNACIISVVLLLNSFTLSGYRSGASSPSERGLNQILRLVSIRSTSQGGITTLQRVVVSLIHIMLHYLGCFAHPRDSCLRFRRIVLLLALLLLLLCPDAHSA